MGEGKIWGEVVRVLGFLGVCFDWDGWCAE